MKLNKTIKLTIIVSVAALVFLGFSIGSAFYTVKRSKSSIDAIGTITVDSDLTLTSSKGRLDKAIENYDKLDRNLKLNERIDNISVLDEKKKEFVNVSILLANSADQQKVKLNLTNNDVAKYILAVDDYKKGYINDEAFNALSGIATYNLLKEKYKDYLAGSTDSSSSSSSSSSSEEIELC